MGGEYPSNTIWEIIVMIQMYLHENSIYWKLFDDQKFWVCIMWWIIQ